MCCVVVCDLETSRMGAPYIYDISHLRVNWHTTNISKASPAYITWADTWGVDKLLFKAVKKILGMWFHEVSYVLKTDKAKLLNTLTQTLRLLHDSVQTFEVGGVIVWLRGVVQQRPHGLDLTYCIVTFLLTRSS